MGGLPDLSPLPGPAGLLRRPQRFLRPALGADYRKLLGAEQGWRELLDRYGFELALLPHDWPLSTMLDREPGWRRVYGDGVAVLRMRVTRKGRV